MGAKFPIFKNLRERYYCWVLQDDLTWKQIGSPDGYAGLTYLTNDLYKEREKYKEWRVLKSVVVLKKEDESLYRYRNI